jgi:Alpha/beta hydrolase family
MFNRFAVFTTMLCAATLSSKPNLQAQKPEVKNIVLVHGAWVDGSGWRGVYDNLVRNGFNVSIVQEPETSFAADLSVEQSGFMARSQVPNAADNFHAVITKPAWREKPSWMVVAGEDRTINPDLERFYAKRANSHTVEVAGASHSVYVSHPKEVADVIESAARAVSNNSDSARVPAPGGSK